MERPDILGLPLDEAEGVLKSAGVSEIRKVPTCAPRFMDEATGHTGEARVIRARWISSREVELVYVYIRE